MTRTLNLAVMDIKSEEWLAHPTHLNDNVWVAGGADPFNIKILFNMDHYVNYLNDYKTITRTYRYHRYHTIIEGNWRGFTLTSAELMKDSLILQKLMPVGISPFFNTNSSSTPETQFDDPTRPSSCSPSVFSDAFRKQR